MGIYVPLHNHTHFSLLDGLPSPKRIIARAKDLGCPAIAMTDHGNICGMVDFQRAGKKSGVKSIIGIELYLCRHDPSVRDETNRQHFHLTILAKNHAGVETLISLVSEMNRPDWFYRKPRINLDFLKRFTSDGNLICLSGCLIGELSHCLFSDHKEACKISNTTNDKSKVRLLLKDNWKDVANEVVDKYIDVFGKDNYYIELQEEGMAVQQIVVDCLRDTSKNLGIPSVATLDSHYACREDADDQRILLYAQMHTTQEEQSRIRASGGDTMEFFCSDKFYIFSYDEMTQHYSQQEIETSLEIADKCGTPKLGRAPCLPKFTTTKDKTSDELLRDMCINGAKQKLCNLDSDKKLEYWNRLNTELDTIKEAKLADYFLIVADVCRFVDQNDGPRGKGRGSGAGSIVNYLIGVTDIDPITYGLYFERFYNNSRNIPPHFNIGAKDFMTWLSDLDHIITGDEISQARKQISSVVHKKHRSYDMAMIKSEAKWIDDNSPKMWCYIASRLEDRDCVNDNNSQIAYATGITNDIRSHPVSTVDAHISLPDIDTDIGVVFRSRVIDYLNEKWGSDKVSQIVTFGRLQGKAALKEVFRAQPNTVKHLMQVRATKLGEDPSKCIIKPHDLCNEITSHIPDEAAIADELQEMREETGDDTYGILQWAVDNIDPVKEAYRWYKPLFDQAMRIEGTKKSQSKHAAGIVIADRPIRELVPMMYDPKSKTQICGLEMGAAEAMGCVKFDFLGVTALDKIWHAMNLVNGKVQQIGGFGEFVDGQID